MKQIKKIRGVRDVLYPESGSWDSITGICSAILEGYGYRKIYLPVMESSELFSRSIGQETDIVAKEMYSFADRKGREISLRPEGTAGAVRAMIENNLLQGSVREKIYYLGPMFRYERPQEGRYRQFYQLGSEIFGSESPQSDAELAETAVKIAEKCAVRASVLKVNSVGCTGCRAPYRDKVAGFLSDKGDALCCDCLRRKDTNTLRVMDCKDPGCRDIYKELPVLSEHLCPACADFYASYKNFLSERNISFVEDNSLVRGLDYYTGPVFELYSGGEVIAAGGRYDGLVKQLGGPDSPACGWAFGIERLAAASDISPARIPEAYIALMPGGDIEICRGAAGLLRDSGITVEEDYEELAPGKKLKTADRKEVRWVILVGEEEVQGGFLSLKNLQTGEQKRVSGSELKDSLLEA